MATVPCSCSDGPTAPEQNPNKKQNKNGTRISLPRVIAEVRRQPTEESSLIPIKTNTTLIISMLYRVGIKVMNLHS
ncbi:MAG: hypothetical protein JWR38_4826 [Mucilaginibacter sp.]|nr:hypothetical protein [Mucilaginibacter sp.]